MKIQYRSPSLVIFESALFRTTSTLLLDEDKLVLIDPTWLPIEIDFIYDFINNLDGERIKHLLFTHSDYDHIIGYGKFKNYITLASIQFVQNQKKQSILEQIASFDDENYITRSYPISYPHINIQISSNPYHWKIGTDTYLIFSAQGHNSDGIITLNKSKGILVVGDYLSNIEFPYVYHSFVAYRKTLTVIENIINQYEINILITGHGDYTDNKDEMQIRINDSRNYLDELEQSVKSNKSFDLDKLLKKYHYPKVMTKFHNGNLALLKKEIAAS